MKFANGADGYAQEKESPEKAFEINSYERLAQIIHVALLTEPRRSDSIQNIILISENHQYGDGRKSGFSEITLESCLSRN